jgi:hypothetical protein
MGWICSRTHLSTSQHPATFACRPGNLGQLARFAAPDVDSSISITAVEPSKYQPGDLYFDGQAIFGSLVLFAILFFSGFGRISGFNAFVDHLIEKRRERKASEVMNARVRLEESWQRDDRPGDPP